MLPRFFVPALDPRHAEITLPKEEGHHLHHVLRLRVGDEVVVFDGQSAAFMAHVATINRDRVTVALQSPVLDSSRPSVSLTLVQSILKGEAMDHVVRDCTMVGVDEIQPVVSEHTTVRTSLLGKSSERWRRIALASTKQCGRLRLPLIHDALTLREWLGRNADAGAFLLVEPAVAGADTLTIRQLAQQPAPPSATLVIGPEGGWTLEERDRALAAGCTSLSLGHLTLRADAVPLAATAALLAIWDE